MEGLKDNNVGANKLAIGTPNPTTKTLQAKATDLSCCFLRASCNGRYFRSLNLLAWTDLSQQSFVKLYFLYSPALQCI